MALTKGNLYFNFDGKSSKDFKLKIVNTSSGMYEDILSASRDITTTKPTGRTKSMLMNVVDNDLSFPLEIAFEEGFTDQSVEQVALWLKQSYFKPFYFEENPSRVFNVMFSDSFSLIHNGLKQGYVSLTALTNSPHVYSPVKLTSKYTVATTLDIAINNKGHEIIYPEISITTTATSLKLETVDKATKKVENIFEIKNLTKGEDLYLDCYREVIESAIVGKHHYEDTTGRYPSLNRGEKILRVTGACTIQLRYREEYIY